MGRIVLVELPVERNDVVYLKLVMAEVAAIAHHHLRQNVLIVGGVPADKMLQEEGFFDGGVGDDFFVGGKVDPLHEGTID